MGTPPQSPNGGVKCRCSRQKSQYWAYIWLHCMLSKLQPARCYQQRRRTSLPQVLTLITGCKRRSMLIVGDDDEMFMTRSFNVAPKTTKQNLTARSDKSVAYVTNNKRLYSTFCTIEANYWQTRSTSCGLFVTAELLVFTEYETWMNVKYTSTCLSVMSLTFLHSYYTTGLLLRCCKQSMARESEQLPLWLNFCIKTWMDSTLQVECVVELFVPACVKGIWSDLLHGLSRLAIVTNVSMSNAHIVSQLRHHCTVSCKYWWDFLQFFSHPECQSDFAKNYKKLSKSVKIMVKNTVSPFYLDTVYMH